MEILKGPKDKYPRLCYYRRPPVGRMLKAHCYTGSTGSWVRIRKDVSTIPIEPLTLCEVIVSGIRSDIWYFL